MSGTYQIIPITQLLSHAELKYSNSFSNFLLKKKDIDKKTILEEYLCSCKLDLLEMDLSLEELVIFLTSFSTLLSQNIRETFYPINPEKLSVQLSELIQEKEQIKSALPKTKKGEPHSFFGEKEDTLIVSEKKIQADQTFLDKSFQFMGIVTDVLLITRIPLLMSYNDKEKAKKEISVLLENVHLAHYMTNKAVIVFACWKKFPFELFFENKNITLLLDKLASKDIMIIGQLFEKTPELIKKLLDISFIREKLNTTDYESLIKMVEGRSKSTLLTYS